VFEEAGRDFQAMTSSGALELMRFVLSRGIGAVNPAKPTSTPAGET
jgi:hypothetical protein